MARRKLARADLARTQAQFYRLAIARWRDEERNRRCHPLDSRFTGASPAPHNAINRLGGRELRLAENVIAIHIAQPSADRTNGRCRLFVYVTSASVCRSSICRRSDRSHAATTSEAFGICFSRGTWQRRYGVIGLY